MEWSVRHDTKAKHFVCDREKLPDMYTEFTLKVWAYMMVAAIVWRPHHNTYCTKTAELLISFFCSCFSCILYVCVCVRELLVSVSLSDFTFPRRWMWWLELWVKPNYVYQVSVCVCVWARARFTQIECGRLDENQNANETHVILIIIEWKTLGDCLMGQGKNGAQRQYYCKLLYYECKNGDESHGRVRKSWHVGCVECSARMLHEAWVKR